MRTFPSPRGSTSEKRSSGLRRCRNALFGLELTVFYRGSLLAAEPSKLHFEKSISLPHPLQICGLLNSSEKISLSFPHSGHLHTNDCRSLKLSHPGQCAGVFIIPSPLQSLP